MPKKKNDIEDIEVTPIEETEGENATHKGANFLPFGKYFLILLVLPLQIYLAYEIIDKNYEEIHSFVNIGDSQDVINYQFEELIVNPAGTNGKRFLVVEIGLELENKVHESMISKHKQKIKHNMIEAISTRTVEQLVRFEEREVMRNELTEIINNSIGVRSVRNLYYTRYVMQ